MQTAPFGGAWSGTRVFVTGHTGFKGSWLCQWLLDMGAEVAGYASEPETKSALYWDLDIARHVPRTIGDIRDAETLARAVRDFRPDVLFHLAAQPIVRRGYAEPVYMFECNVMGTVNALDACRGSDVRAVVGITTDKVYENSETGRPFRESDPLGGRDPYSASKACADIAIGAYRASFFEAEGTAVASARAGNVIGGGDWAPDRIVPDCVRALMADEPIIVRNPAAVRPWQHVIEPLAGYLRLGGLLLEDRDLAGAYNFGPGDAGARSVEDVVDAMIDGWGGGSWRLADEANPPHEAATLRLDITKAEEKLGWSPVWDFATTVRRTVEWYRAYADDPSSAASVVDTQLRSYEADAERVQAGSTAVG